MAPTPWTSNTSTSVTRISINTSTNQATSQQTRSEKVEKGTDSKTCAHFVVIITKMVSTLARPEEQSVTTATTTITSLKCAEPGSIEIKVARKMEAVVVSVLQLIAMKQTVTAITTTTGEEAVVTVGCCRLTTATRRPVKIQ